MQGHVLYSSFARKNYETTSICWRRTIHEEGKRELGQPPTGPNQTRLNAEKVLSQVPRTGTDRAAAVPIFFVEVSFRTPANKHIPQK